MENPSSLEGLVEASSTPSRRKVRFIDGVANATFSIAAVGGMDLLTGAAIGDVLASRGVATPFNIYMGGLYGQWREKVCKITSTTPESSNWKKGFADWIAFTSFNLPYYLSVRALGGFVSEGQPNWESIVYGAGALVITSPLAGPGLGLYTDLLRRTFGIPSASSGAYHKRPQD
ncbi:MAG: L-alanine exporter AlaE [Nanoarchaeota archaeon]|nr:L-alanine exporter AlaE [Nanoarchaeota archaeon]